jgi:hypothetical protein
MYVEGRSVSLDQAEVLSEQLAELELKLESLKTLLSVNKLLESQNLSVDAEALSKCNHRLVDPSAGSPGSATVCECIAWTELDGRGAAAGEA